MGQDIKSARPAPYNGIVAQIVHWICGAFLILSGWKLQGDWPDAKKAVLLAAPHTSNWDGINMLAAVGYYRIKVRWMGKKSLTTGPFGGIIKALGCVPIDRSASHDLVQSMSEEFAASSSMLLLVPPEGTRSLTPVWKTGFYHIAKTAGVPIIVTVLDYGTRTVYVPALFYPTGDIDADLIQLKAYYANAVGRHRAKFTAA
jgi:1-acyl-sn-glycerol-3-phosphate acyltransferase